MDAGSIYQFRIVIYPSEDKDGGVFTAHCLSTDLIGDDDTVEGAVSKLLETLEAALAAAQKHRANIFREAPREYWDKLAHASSLAPELMERIVFNANKRIRRAGLPVIDLENQCELRQLPKAQQDEVQNKYLKPLRRAFELTPEDGVSDEDFFA